ncbi:helix-hairpin-helix domain-containing protein [Cellulophaga baltica]|uniref:ComEA family DNA-binding protein n=1 Tax=Cellulophaga TaxID=104264 RepID=UPI001C066148|nr:MULTISPECIES: helix-hairpin-helix domain-containing protein [Cellulophaga]MBU2994943.1 helix-hairpin-helix domain-containing protein [Cellulophaga baltica]MDO6766337.1 helix-hairpin-helix domain-containing protein [Cellulophaga sp. 1_MG-2023]
MNKFKSHFKFDKQERSGIFFLLLFIVLLQIGYFAYKSYVVSNDKINFVLDVNNQAAINHLKNEKLQEGTYKMYPFNPNYITDYKGYQLGMSVEEIDRLHSFRSAKKFVNSSKEFQKVTRVSDSLLSVIAPFFKFPDWVRNQAKKKSAIKVVDSKRKSIVKKDLNKVTAEELKLISGVGDKLSARIVKYRNRLGGFITEKQLYEVYYLDAEVANKVLKMYTIQSKPSIMKIDINASSAYEISQLVYINYNLSKKIVQYREDNNGIKSFSELLNIEGFPSEKIDIISLYLQL